MTTRSVLITGARSAAALDIARDFRAAGWLVHLADSTISRMARWSSLDIRHHRYPAPRQEGTAFRRWVAGAVEELALDLVVPTCEEVFHLATAPMHDVLGERLFAPPPDTLRQLHDKLTFAQAASEWGVATPESVAIHAGEGLERFNAGSTEWVFKPRFTRFGGSTLIGPDARTLAAQADAIGEGWMAQRRIRGDEASLHFIAHRGTLCAFAAYGSGWRLKGGASYAFEPVSQGRAESLRGIAKALVRGGKLHGQFGCDVMFDNMGAAMVIECNPRATSGVHLLAGDGALARAISDGVSVTASDQRTAYLGPAMIAFGLPHALASGRLDDWRACLASGRDAISRSGDRMPFLGALADSAKFSLSGLAKGISTTAATTHDIEWNGEEFAP